MMERTDVLIVGGGLVGASIALALDASGCSATLVEAMPSRAPATGADVVGDGNDRNLVLARASVNALQALGVWPRLERAAGTIRRLEVSRAGEFGRVRMTAEDVGVDALGRVVPGTVLTAALEARLAECRIVQRLAPAKLESLEPILTPNEQEAPPHPNPLPWGERGTSAQRLAGEGAQSCTGWRARIVTGDGEREIEARLIVGADGSDSLVRRQVGIGAHEQDYRQSLFVCSVACGQDWPDCAFERFSDDGPVALLPLPNARRGLVLTVSADRHAEVVALDDTAFLALAQHRFGWKLGAFTRPGKRFPHRIRRVLAGGLTAPRAVLIGNAAQTVHPIGAQGFNLGLRDALTLAELVATADDPGTPALLREYAARRQADREGVIAFSHGLISLACLAQPALAPLRSLTMWATDRLPPLRHAVARRGMGFRGLSPVATLDPAP